MYTFIVSAWVTEVILFVSVYLFVPSLAASDHVFTLKIHGIIGLPTITPYSSILALFTHDHCLLSTLLELTMDQKETVIFCGCFRGE